ILDTRTKSQIPNQLTVLAGDYYSGLYYFLLSEIDDFELIHVLATAIKEINEQKMNLYYRERLSPEEFIYIIKQIETLLFTHVSDHIGTEPLDRTIAEWFAINKLTIEKNKTTSPLIDVWRTNCDHQQRCSEQAWNDLMDARMTHLKTSITSQNRHHIPSMIKERLYEYKMSDEEEGRTMTEQTKEERVHHVFEKIYTKYDSMNSIISFHRHKAWRKDVMKRMAIEKDTTALDLCCGTGDWSISLAEAVGTGGQVTGLDFSEN